MPIEIETKFKVQFPKELRKKLKYIGTKFVSRKLEQDIYYKASEFNPALSVVRLRLAGDCCIFTIKRAGNNGKSSKYKIRDEAEVKISNAKVFQKKLKTLNFKQSFKKEKIRETYRCKGAKVLIDKLPHIGFYVEIEGPKIAIKKIVKLLGLDIEKAIPHTYVQIFNKYKRKMKKPNLDLVFKRKV